jgi:hypothetical protein
MNRWLTLAIVALIAVAAPVHAAGVTGQYLESRTCDVWTGPCFANAEMNLGGKQAVLAWKVEKGTLDNVQLDGLGVVAVVVASDTLGLQQTGPSKAILIIDEKANTVQKQALIHLAQKQGGDLVRNIVAIESAPVSMTLCPCDGNGCAKLTAGKAKVETRCLDATHDKVCGNESAFYPPLAKGVDVKPAMSSEHGYSGKGLNETWSESDRRGAYVGSFQMN